MHTYMTKLKMDMVYLLRYEKILTINCRNDEAPVTV